MNLLTIDRVSLPADALSMLKQWSRIEHSRDDLLLTDMAAQAIDYLEKTANVNLFAATLAFSGTELWNFARCYWLNDPSGQSAVRFALPVNNVRAFTALNVDIDVADLYRVEQAELGGVATAWLIGPCSSVMSYAFTFDVGVETMADMIPALRTRVMRRAASLYENREDSTKLSSDDMSGESLTTWRPDA